MMGPGFDPRAGAPRRLGRGRQWTAITLGALALLAVGVGVGVIVVAGPGGGTVAGVGNALRRGPSTASSTTSSAASSGSTASSSSTSAPAPSFATVYAQQRSGVVRIEVLGCTDRGIGTGFLLSPTLVATVDHVIAGSLVVSLIDGQQRTTGQVIGTDPTNDLALVRAAQPLTGYHFQFATTTPQVGDEVAAIGFPIGGPITLTQGGVSGLHRSITVEGQRRHGMIETDAALNPGNSGGPLLTQDGQVIGLVDAGDLNANGIGYAVPASQAAPEMSGWQQYPAPAASANCANPLGPRQVHATVPAPAGINGRAAHGIATSLATYFAGINSGDYWSAYNTFSPSMRARFSERSFAQGDATSYDFDQHVLAAHQRGPYAADVTLSFTSLQAAQKGPDGDTCDNWTLTYHMIQGNDSAWYINGTSAYGATDHTTC